MSKKTFDLRKTVIAAVAAAGLLVAAPAIADAATGPESGKGPGMMGGSEQECDMGPGTTGGKGQGQGMGRGMMGGQGQGHGKGPGMMGGSEQECDMGPGTTGGKGQGQGHGMGSGMMGGQGQGHGMGSGMMGGYGHGMGPGMMGYAGAPELNLTNEQRAKADKIHDASRKRVGGVMGGMLDASSKLRELLSASKRDRAAIGAAYKQVADLRQQMFEVGLDAQDEFERILTGDQREQLRR